MKRSMTHCNNSGEPWLLLTSRIHAMLLMEYGLITSSEMCLCDEARQQY